MNVKTGNGNKHFRTVDFDSSSNQVILIDQKKLPHQFELIRLDDFHSTGSAIQDMTVRGAGAIGATAAYGFAQGIRCFNGQTTSAEFSQHVEKVFQTLAYARPTAVDPLNALKWMKEKLHTHPDQDKAAIDQLVLDLACQFADEDVEHCNQIGIHGEKLLQGKKNILTHCNAGWLAFVDVGSATAPMYHAWENGQRFHIYVDETRPRLQGASLTAWELYNHGIPHTVIPDNVAGHLMKQGLIDMVLVGSDRVVGKTGDVANKIGTYTKAVLAHHNNVPFYVAIPMSTIDWDLDSGDSIPIEQRSEDEVVYASGLNEVGDYQKIRIANPGSPAANYGFDVTPAELITGIITPHGIFKPKDLKKLLPKESSEFSK